MACPSDNLGSLLNGLNTILLGVMAILRHQTKADMHDNAAKNLQSLIVDVEFLRDDMTLCVHHPSYTSHPTFPLLPPLPLRAAASPNRFETKPWLRTAARSSADSLAALARYRKYISLLNISLACYSIGTKANQTHCASGVCQGRRNTGNDASAPELPAQGSDGAHGPVYEGPDTHVTAQDQPAGHGTRSTQEGEHILHARIWHRLWGISEPFPIPSVKSRSPSPLRQYNGGWVFRLFTKHTLLLVPCFIDCLDLRFTRPQRSNSSCTGYRARWADVRLTP